MTERKSCRSLQSLWMFTLKEASCYIRVWQPYVHQVTGKPKLATSRCHVWLRRKAWPATVVPGWNYSCHPIWGPRYYASESNHPQRTHLNSRPTKLWNIKITSFCKPLNCGVVCYPTSSNWNTYKVIGPLITGFYNIEF